MIRSKFDVLMDVLVVFYEHNSLCVDSVIRKAGLNNSSQREVIDKLLLMGVLSISNDKFLFLTNSFEQKLNKIIIFYKKSKELYDEVYNK